MLNIQKNLTEVNYKRSSRRKIEYIVMHYDANNGATAYNNTKYFKSTYRGASAHAFVDETSIWQSVNWRDIAWSVGANKYIHPSARNENTINIELCSRVSNGMYYIPEQTFKNGAELAAYLLKAYGLGIDKLIRHYDVTGKQCPEPFVRNQSEWGRFRTEVNDLMRIETKTIDIEGKKKDVQSVMIGDNNYIKLRDLSDILQIDYNPNTKGISVKRL